MNYHTILFDLDDTLLDFGKSESAALKKSFAAYHLAFNPEIFAIYQKHNHALWKAFEQNKISKADILANRFRLTFAECQISDPCPGFEEYYQNSLAQEAFLMEHAMEVCRELARKHQLYIVTNGVYTTQKNRLELSGLSPFIKDSFVSEQIGFQKPRKEYFDYVKSHIPGFQCKDTLLVGDSLTSDIRGAIEAGIPCCHFQPRLIHTDQTHNQSGVKKQPARNDISGTGCCPDYVITDLRQLFTIIGSP